MFGMNFFLSHLALLVFVGVFVAQAGVTYSVLQRDSLDPAHPWRKLRDMESQAMTGPLEALDEGADTSALRFYQLVSPALPRAE